MVLFSGNLTPVTGMIFMLHEQGKGLAEGVSKADTEDKEDQAAQTTPPLTLATTGQIWTPAPPAAAMFNGFLYFTNGRAEAREISSRF